MTVGDLTEKPETVFLFPEVAPKKLLQGWHPVDGLCDVLHVHGFKGIQGCLGGGVYVTTEVEVSSCFDSDNVADTLNYVQLLELLKALQRQQDHSSSAAVLGHFERLCLCAPHVVSANVHGMEVGVPLVAYRPTPQSQGTPTLVTCEALSYFTIHVTIGCAAVERDTLQPLNLRLFFDTDALPLLHMHGENVQLAVAKAVVSEACYTIERAAAVALQAAGDTLPTARIIKVVVEKPEIGFLTSNDMEYASFTMTRRRRQGHDDDGMLDEHGASLPVARDHPLKGALAYPKQKPSNAVAASNFKRLSQHSSEYNVVASRVMDALHSVVKRQEKPGALRILDIGSGFGWLLSSCVAPFVQQQGSMGCIGHYCAFEPNEAFHPELMQRANDLGLTEASGTLSLRAEKFAASSFFARAHCAKFDVVLFCHSLYESKRAEGVGLVQHALSLLAPRGQCLVFHRAKRIFHALPKFEATLGTNDHTLLSVAVDPAVVAIPLDDIDAARAVLGAYHGADIAPDAARAIVDGAAQRGGATLDAAMVSIVWERTSGAPLAHSAVDALVSQLGTDVVLAAGTMEYARRMGSLKNKSARRQLPLAIVEARCTQDVVASLEWCQRYGVPFTVGGGCHSSHCTADAHLMVSLSRMRQATVDVEGSTLTCEGGCVLGDLVAVLDPVSLMIPLGSRPSVGMGLVLHGGLGHYTRSHGLSCDYVLSATVVLPNGSVVVATPDQHAHLFACLRGAGSIVGVVTSLVFKCVPFQSLDVQRSPFCGFAAYFALCAASTDTNGSIDAYATATTTIPSSLQFFTPSVAATAVGGATATAIQSIAPSATAGAAYRTTTYLELFDAELHCEFPKAAEDFKRTLLIPRACADAACYALDAAMQRAPTTKCYMHVMQCGPSSNAPACADPGLAPRGWEWAVVVTARWDACCDAAPCRQWVYATLDALPMCYVYATDLGHGAQDALYGFRAFGSAHALQRAAAIKGTTDPKLLMANGQSLLYPPQPLQLPDNGSGRRSPSLVIALCGKRYSGKDAVAEVLASALQTQSHAWHAAVAAHTPTLPAEQVAPLQVRVLSISDAFKQDWCHRHGADFHRMLTDRAYKEARRPAMNLEASAMTPQDNVLSLQAALCSRHDGAAPDVVIVTGMRERNLADTLAACGVRSLRVLVRATDTSRGQRGWVASEQDHHPRETDIDAITDWDAVLDNNTQGFDAIRLDLMEHVVSVALGTHLGHALGTAVPLPAAVMRLVRSVPNFPFVGVDFKDVLSIASSRRIGTAPTMLHQVVGWMADTIRSMYPQCSAIATVESGGCVWASPVAVCLQLPLIVVRKRGAGGTTPKEPPPSHVVGHSGSNASRHATTLEVRCGALPQDGDVVLVDDVYASGRTAMCIERMVVSARSKLAGVVCVARFPLCEDEQGDATTRSTLHVHSIVSFPCR